MTVKASKKPKYISVLGKKDPRGPDNTIMIWINDAGQLCIKVDKPAVRCYPFSHVEEDASSITVIQNK
jgi:hypothetical protein